MTLDVAQSLALLIIAVLCVIILMRILVVVHGQNHKVKDLESRLNAIEKSDIDPTMSDSFSPIQNPTPTKKG
jgi:hypothetical protein